MFTKLLRWLSSFFVCDIFDCKKKATSRCERCGRFVCDDHFFCGYICQDCMNY